jgi:hypothetical protein
MAPAPTCMIAPSNHAHPTTTVRVNCGVSSNTIIVTETRAATAARNVPEALSTSTGFTADPNPSANHGNIDPQIEADHADQAHRHDEADGVESPAVAPYHTGRDEQAAQRARHGETDTLDDMGDPADRAALFGRDIHFISHGRLLAGFLKQKDLN